MLEYVHWQAQIFAGLANPNVGSIAINYQQVPCDPPGNIILTVLDNRGAHGWARFNFQVPGCNAILLLQTLDATQHL